MKLFLPLILIFSIPWMSYGKSLLDLKIDKSLFKEITRSQQNSLLELDTFGDFQMMDCLHLVKEFIVPLQEYAYELIEKSMESPILYKLIYAEEPEKLCQKKEDEKKIVQEVKNTISVHKKHIGILVAPDNVLDTQSFLQGLKQGFLIHKIHHQEFFFQEVKNIKDLTHQFIDLIFYKKVSAIIYMGKSTNHELAETFIKLGKNFHIPTLFMTDNDQLVKKSPYFFRLFPDRRSLIRRLANSIYQDGVENIALLFPKNRPQNRFRKQLRIFFSLLGINLSEEISYNPNDFYSINFAVKKLLKIDLTLRRKEYNHLYLIAKNQAASRGIAFNSKSVVLPPKIQVDAVFIADHFHMVKHILKLLHYHGIEKLKFYGSHEWRSRSLLDPYDPLLKGAKFFDFVGDYSKIPIFSNKKHTDNLKFFQPTKKTMHMDAQLLGYYAGQLAYLANQTHTRREVVKAWEISRFNDAFMNDNLTFKKDHNNYWPSFIFKVDGQILTLLKQSNLP